jgi:hypothetical protein
MGRESQVFIEQTWSRVEEMGRDQWRRPSAGQLDEFAASRLTHPSGPPSADLSRLRARSLGSALRRPVGALRQPCVKRALLRDSAG